MVLSHCLTLDNRNVWTKHGVIVSDDRGINREVLDHVVTRYGFEVSIIWMANHPLKFVSKRGCGDIYFGKPLKVFPDGLHEEHALRFLAIDV